MSFFVRFIQASVLVQAVVMNFAYANDTKAPPVAATPAAQWVKAEIRKIDIENNKITLRHEPLTELNMGAMTMVFRVDDGSLLKGLAVGDRIKFIPVNRAGQLLVISIQKDE
ncbi:MAG: copper-binding protein [Oxalobacteraceae bacterium]|jgi:Cu(I)/Ag(I) efflux system protein CusF|nr:copper-binding protein [Oxalobacteraceae bacterium]